MRKNELTHKHNGLLRNGRERKKFQNLPDILYNVHVTKKLLTQLVTWLLHVFETIKINKIF